MHTISKLALVCAVTLFSAQAMYGMNNNDQKPKDIENNQLVELNNEAKKVSNEEIFEAAKYGAVEFFEHNDIDLKIKGKYGCTPLHFACCKGNIAVVTFIVGQDTEHLKQKRNSGWTPLHDACLNNHRDVVQFIVEKDSELLKEIDNHVRTPLHLACYQGNKEIIKLLLFYGADFNAVNNDGKKPLMDCNQEIQTEICNYMKELASSQRPSDVRVLLARLCKENKAFAQKALQFILSLKVIHGINNLTSKVPKPLIFMMVTMLDLNEEVDQLIIKWTTND